MMKLILKLTFFRPISLAALRITFAKLKADSFRLLAMEYGVSVQFVEYQDVMTIKCLRTCVIRNTCNTNTI